MLQKEELLSHHPPHAYRWDVKEYRFLLIHRMWIVLSLGAKWIETFLRKAVALVELRIYVQQNLTNQAQHTPEQRSWLIHR